MMLFMGVLGVAAIVLAAWDDRRRAVEAARRELERMRMMHQGPRTDA